MAGSAPRIVWIRRSNCATLEIEALLRRHADDIELLGQRPGPAFQVLL